MGPDPSDWPSSIPLHELENELSNLVASMFWISKPVGPHPHWQIWVLTYVHQVVYIKPSDGQEGVKVGSPSNAMSTHSSNTTWVVFNGAPNPAVALEGRATARQEIPELRLNVQSSPLDVQPHFDCPTLLRLT
jgi:hypothetical protein